MLPDGAVASAGRGLVAAGTGIGDAKRIALHSCALDWHS